MPDDSIVEIKVALTAIARDLEHTSHRARNIEQKLDAFVLLRDLEPIELRISVLESFQTWAQRGIMAAVMAAVAGLVLVSKKGGF